MRLLRSSRGKSLVFILISFISISIFYTNCSHSGFEVLEYNENTLPSVSAQNSSTDIPANPNATPDNEIGISVHNAEAVKGQPLSFKIELTKVADNDITINVKTMPDTAIPVFDYKDMAQQIVIPAGQTSAFVTVDSLNFDNATIDKSFKLVATESSSGVFVQNIGIGTIKKNSQKLILKSIAAKSRNICGVTESNTVICRWDMTANFSPMDGLSNIKEIALGATHSCALSYAGKVQCWGNNSSGQLGNSTTTKSNSPVEVSGLTDVKQISLGDHYSCALLNSGSVKCWGNNSSGQLGNKTTVNSSTPVSVTDLSDVKLISAGSDHSCAVLNTGTVKCWGKNDSGQLGNKTTTNSNAPVSVPGLSNIAQAKSGHRYTCAVLGSGSVKCWGDNSWGELGDNTTTNSLVPVSVMGLSDVNQISVNTNSSLISSYGSHTCALLKSGTVKCWGYNAFGQLGNNTTNQTSPSPVTVSGLANVDQISLGESYSCARTMTNVVHCWGDNRFGELGTSHLTSTFVPLNVSDSQISTQSIDLGFVHFCNVTSAGTVKCWGFNNNGQLGDNTTVNSTIPVEVKNLSDVKEIQLTGFHTCALLNTGGVKCWGYNLSGQLGNNTTANSSIPVDVSGLSDVQQISLGMHHSCALLQNGTVKCWGYNYYGQVGNNTTTNSHIPVDVGLSGVKQISVGQSHSCALLNTGIIKCWGSNFSGQIGKNSSSTSLTPVEVSGISDIKKISMGANHSCALSNSGVVKCWGSNFFGQLGINSAPTGEVADLTAVKDLQVGFDSSCALTEDNDLKCWGSNLQGQMGTPLYTTLATPKTIMKAKSFKLGGRSILIERLDGIYLRAGIINPYHPTPVELTLPLN